MNRYISHRVTKYRVNKESNSRRVGDGYRSGDSSGRFTICLWCWIPELKIDLTGQSYPNRKGSLSLLQLEVVKETLFRGVWLPIDPVVNSVEVDVVDQQRPRSKFLEYLVKLTGLLYGLRAATGC